MQLLRTLRKTLPSQGIEGKYRAEILENQGNLHALRQMHQGMSEEGAESADTQTFHGGGVAGALISGRSSEDSGKNRIPGAALLPDHGSFSGQDYHSESEKPLGQLQQQRKSEF